MSRIIETLGPPPEWMMAAAKRTDVFFKRVRTAAGAAAPAGAAAEAPAPASSSTAGAAAGAEQAVEYVLYSKEEFEAINKCQVGESVVGMGCVRVGHLSVAWLSTCTQAEWLLLPTAVSHITRTAVRTSTTP